MATSTNTLPMSLLSGFARWRLGVHGRSASILLATLLASLAISGILIQRSQEQEIHDEIDRRGTAIAEMTGHVLAYSAANRDSRTIELILQELTRDQDIVYARMENSRGNTLGVAGGPPNSRNPVRQFSKEIRLNGEKLGRLTLNLSTERIASSLIARQHEALMWQAVSALLIVVCGFAALAFLVTRPTMRVAATRNVHPGTDKPKPEPALSNMADKFCDWACGFNAPATPLNEPRTTPDSRVAIANHKAPGPCERLIRQTETHRSKNAGLEQPRITDPLAGLYNRYYFEQLMENEVARAVRNDETLSFLLIDIDRFRSIHNQFGESGGNEAIRTVASAITGRIGKKDVVCRYGNDEFVVLCRRATIANALSIADDLLQRLACSPALSGCGEGVVTASIGIATIPGVHAISSAADFFRCASEALHHCKQNNRGAALHYSMMGRNTRTATSR